MTQTLKCQFSYCLWHATPSYSRFPVNDVWWCISCVSDIFACVIYCILLPVQLTGKTPIENEQWCDDWDNLWLLLSVQCVIAVSVNLAYWAPCPRHLLGSGVERIDPLISWLDVIKGPSAGSGVVRIDPLHFLAGYRKRQLNQVLLCLSYILACFIVLLFIMAPFYVLLVFVAMCSVFWLFWLSYQYLPSDRLERLLWGSLVARGSSSESPGQRVHMIFLLYCIASLFYYVFMLSPAPTWYIILLLWCDISYLCWKCR